MNRVSVPRSAIIIPPTVNKSLVDELERFSVETSMFLGEPALALYRHLCIITGGLGGEVGMTIEQLAGVSRMSSNTVRRSLARLFFAGLVKITISTSRRIRGIKVIPAGSRSRAVANALMAHANESGKSSDSLVSEMLSFIASDKAGGVHSNGDYWETDVGDAQVAHQDKENKLDINGNCNNQQPVTRDVRTVTVVLRAAEVAYGDHGSIRCRLGSEAISIAATGSPEIKNGMVVVRSESETYSFGAETVKYVLETN